MNAKLVSKYGAQTTLCEIPESEFLTGSVLSEALKASGFTEGAKTVISQNNWWGMTATELEEFLAIEA